MTLVRDGGILPPIWCAVGSLRAILITNGGKDDIFVASVYLPEDDVHGASRWGTVVQRTTSRAPVEKGGWSAYTNFVFGISMVNPAANNYIRGNGLQAMTGWPDAPKLEQLRNAWFDAPDLDAQKKIARELQLQAFQDVPYWPTGMFFQATAYRKSITDVLKGFPLFYNVRRA